jgi:hypothetical protein
MGEHEEIRPHFSRAIYEKWITRADKYPKYCTAAQLDRYRGAITWYDWRGGEKIENKKSNQGKRS